VLEGIRLNLAGVGKDHGGKTSGAASLLSQDRATRSASEYSL
jgi:hypothetical protein